MINFVWSLLYTGSMSFLFHEVIFGPVHSRRLGVSLGVNLLPVDKKFCTFNCIYCECGWTYEKITGDTPGLPGRDDVIEKLEEKLKEMVNTVEWQVTKP